MTHACFEPRELAQKSPRGSKELVGAFHRLSKVEEKLGPYGTFKEARDAWASRAFSTIDHCLIRYRIVEDAA